jgi:hypothetical protein
MLFIIVVGVNSLAVFLLCLFSHPSGERHTTNINADGLSWLAPPFFFLSFSFFLYTFYISRLLLVVSACKREREEVRKELDAVALRIFSLLFV